MALKRSGESRYQPSSLYRHTVLHHLLQDRDAKSNSAIFCAFPKGRSNRSSTHSIGERNAEDDARHSRVGSSVIFIGHVLPFCRYPARISMCRRLHVEACSLSLHSFERMQLLVSCYALYTQLRQEILARRISPCLAQGFRSAQNVDSSPCTTASIPVAILDMYCFHDSSSSHV